MNKRCVVGGVDDIGWTVMVMIHVCAAVSTDGSSNAVPGKVPRSLRCGTGQS
jgi:hypothetical protein